MKKTSPTKTLLIAILILIIQGCADVQINNGVEAFNQGDYDTAAAHWNALAENGNYLAQYNVGLLWESGLGSTPKDLDIAANWYRASGNQGFTPALVRLANMQVREGYESQAIEAYNLAARFGNENAITALNLLGEQVPAPDLLQQQQLQKQQKDADAAEGYGALLYLLACSQGACSDAPPSRSTSSNTNRNWERDLDTAQAKRELRQAERELDASLYELDRALNQKPLFPE